MFADILRLSIKDLFTPKFIALSILPLVFSALIIAAIAMFGGRELYEALNAAIPGEAGALAEYPMLAKILSLGIAKWLIGAIFYAVGAYLVVMLSVFCALAVAGFLTPMIAREINRRHYRVDEAQLANVGLARQTALMGNFAQIYPDHAYLLADFSRARAKFTRPAPRVFLPLLFATFHRHRAKCPLATQIRALFAGLRRI